MAAHARVGSIEAIDAFRASLITYLETARPTLDEISAEVMRTRIWLEQDRFRFWERELERRRRLLTKRRMPSAAPECPSSGRPPMSRPWPFERPRRP